MDRLVEFRSISEMLKLQRGIQQSGGHVKAKRWLSAGFVAKFVTGAKAIVRDTRLTSTKLEKLHLLCDPCNNRGDDEIEELTAIVKQDVGGLNRSILSLKSLVQRHVPQTTGNQNLQHFTAIVTGLHRDLGVVSSDFKELLESQSERNKNAAAVHTATIASRGADAIELHPYGHTGAEMRARRTGVVSGNEAVCLEMPEEEVQLLDQLEAEKRKNRDKVTKSIESTIAELGGLFSQLAGLVAEQGEHIQRIDDDIAATQESVEGARAEITKYYKSMASNRGLILKSFAALLFIFTFFLLFR